MANQNQDGGGNQGGGSPGGSDAQQHNQGSNQGGGNQGGGGQGGNKGGGGKGKSGGRRGVGVTILAFGDDSNRQITINTIKERVRGAFSLRNVKRQASNGMAAMPDIPSELMMLDWDTQSYTITDPLKKNVALMQQVNHACNQSRVIRGAEYRAMDDRSGECRDKDKWFTLVDEMRRKHEAGIVQIVEGRLPTEEEMRQIPGKRLHDPWNSSRMKAEYHEDQLEYARGLDRVQ